MILKYKDSNGNIGALKDVDAIRGIVNVNGNVDVLATYNRTSVFIAHDLTKAQAEGMIEEVIKVLAKESKFNRVYNFNNSI